MTYLVFQPAVHHTYQSWSIVIKKVHIKPHLQKKVRIDKVLIRLETFKNRTRQCKARTDIMVHLEDGSHCTSVSMKCSSLCRISSLGIASTSLTSDLFCIQQIEDFGHVMKHRHSRHCPFAICLPYVCHHYNMIFDRQGSCCRWSCLQTASRRDPRRHKPHQLPNDLPMWRASNRVEPCWTKLNQVEPAMLVYQRVNLHFSYGFPMVFPSWTKGRNIGLQAPRRSCCNCWTWDAPTILAKNHHNEGIRLKAMTQWPWLICIYAMNMIFTFFLQIILHNFCRIMDVIQLDRIENIAPHGKSKKLKALARRCVSLKLVNHPCDSWRMF